MIKTFIRHLRLTKKLENLIILYQIQYGVYRNAIDVRMIDAMYTRLTRIERRIRRLMNELRLTHYHYAGVAINSTTVEITA